MAIRIEFDHAVWDTYEYKSGADIDVDSGALVNLLRPADTAFAQSDGYFFDTFDGVFVFGFEQNRTGGGSRGSSERYFDLFATPVENAERAKLIRLRDALREAKAPEFDADVDGSVTVRVEARETDEPESGNDLSDGNSPNDADASSVGVDVGWVDQEIAETWERLRRNSLQLYATLTDVDELVDDIDDALRHVSFVSEERNPVSYFDVIGDPRRRDEQPEINVSDDLEEHVAKLRAAGELTWERLPTYRDELDDLIAGHVDNLSASPEPATADTTDGPVGSAISEFGDRVAEAVQDHREEAAFLYTAAYGGALRTEKRDGDGKLSWLSVRAKSVPKLLSIPFLWLAVTSGVYLSAQLLPVGRSLLGMAAVLGAGVVSAAIALPASITSRNRDDDLLVLSVLFVWLGTALLVTGTSAALFPLAKLVSAAVLLATLVVLAIPALSHLSEAPERLGTSEGLFLSMPVAWAGVTWGVLLIALGLSTGIRSIGTAVMLAVFGLLVLAVASPSEPDEVEPEFGPFIEGADDLDVDPQVVEPRVVAAVDEELQDMAGNLFDEIRSDVDGALESDLADAVEEESGELARRIVDDVVEARTSFAHEQVHGED